MSLNDIDRIVFKGERIELAKVAVQRVKICYLFLIEFSKDKVIYGINTGFGPMAQYRIDEKQQKQLQYNLIRSHASGSGELLSPQQVKAAMLVRLNNFLIGKSGVHPQVIFLLRDFINNDITPCIYAHGGVGASGDLVQLAHLALTLIGEGEVIYEGKQQPTSEIMNQLGLEPLEIYLREGLALINGTSVMTGIGLVNMINASRQLDWVISGSSLINEMVRAYDDHLSPELNGVKLHKGQQEIAERMRTNLAGSRLIRKRDEHLYNKKTEELVFEDKVQEYYSVRCVPQILGPILDTYRYAEEVLVNEANSVCDNPIIDPEKENVYHGGNFHGDYVSLEMDKVKTATTKLSMLAERQLNFLLNHKINNILPPFINHGVLGLNFGMQGAQFTAVSTVAENQTLSFPNYVHSIPNNNDNQDMVSMGTNSASLCKKVLDNTNEVLSIYWLALIQAVDYLKVKADLAEKTGQIHYHFREEVPVFSEDPIIHLYTKKIHAILKEKSPKELLFETLELS